MLATTVAEPVQSVRQTPSSPSIRTAATNVTGRAGVAHRSDDVLEDDFGAGLAEAEQEVEADGRFPVLPDALEQDLVQVFKLLSDETRLRILLYLAREGELHVTALCKRLSQSQPAVSHHLALLRNAGIIEPRRDGKHNFYSIRQQRFVGLISEFFATVRDPETDAVEFDEFVLSKSE
ncbi:HTH-type transcriptional regulator KmtR [Alienimonas californiensis]|uniref:HTH-type transcriptional regulator KmtR n=1 Tax=Alienimonas californiensis TaxID=2527989 RepID=A0A517PF45_9PLAN|nr:metalloregulator ArsR/SmtB family transcription factor [Alienimonas californiensis]QDT17998.1 HTH-type transcriptional regulator KmtR [Alienimonas californiensis]